MTSNINFDSKQKIFDFNEEFLKAKCLQTDDVNLIDENENNLKKKQNVNFLRFIFLFN